MVLSKILKVRTICAKKALKMRQESNLRKLLKENVVWKRIVEFANKTSHQSCHLQKQVLK